MKIGMWRYWIGRWRMRWGFCPWCDSSPPLPECLICEGSYDYGPPAPWRARQWRERWEQIRNG